MLIYFFIYLYQIFFLVFGFRLSVDLTVTDPNKIINNIIYIKLLSAVQNIVYENQEKFVRVN